MAVMMVPLRSLILRPIPRATNTRLSESLSCSSGIVNTSASASISCAASSATLFSRFRMQARSIAPSALDTSLGLGIGSLPRDRSRASWSILRSPPQCRELPLCNQPPVLLHAIQESGITLDAVFIVVVPDVHGHIWRDRYRG